MPVVEEFRIRKDYVRPRRGGLGSKASAKLQKCPLTGAMVPVEDASRHVQAVLRSRTTGGNASTACTGAVSFDDVRVSLSGFAAQRPDLCGTMSEEVAASCGAKAETRLGPSLSTSTRRIQTVASRHEASSSIGLAATSMITASPRSLPAAKRLRLPSSCHESIA